MQTILSADLRVETQRDFVTACQVLNGSFRCGKYPKARQCTIAKMRSNTIQNGKMLDVKLALGKFEKELVLPCDPHDPENVLQ